MTLTLSLTPTPTPTLTHVNQALEKKNDNFICLVLGRLCYLNYADVCVIIIFQVRVHRLTSRLSSHEHQNDLNTDI